MYVYTVAKSVEKSRSDTGRVLLPGVVYMQTHLNERVTWELWKFAGTTGEEDSC